MIGTFKALKRISFEQHTRGLNSIGIATNRNVLFNPTVPELYEIAFLNEPPSDPHTLPSSVSTNGAICAYSGLKTFRQPYNSRIVQDTLSQKTVNWNNSNTPITHDNFEILEKTAIDYVNHKGRCIVVDGYAGWDPQERMKVRTYCTRAYHALFMRNMLIRPTQKQLDEDFTRGVDIHLVNAGQMEASKKLVGSNSITALDLAQKKIVIMGTQFAGQMKKSIFKMLSYYYPRKNILTMHAAATQYNNQNTSVMIGLSTTGKTSLALKAQNTKLIGDDEICWGENGIFNVEGGVYAKITGLDQASQPQVFKAIKFGSILENAAFYPNSRIVNYHDLSIAPNARAAFPLNYLNKVCTPAVGTHPKNIIMLVNDSKGVLPPVAKLTAQQAIYQFLSGYTVKINPIDNKVSAPMFSACFGQTFIPLAESVYAKLLWDKIKKFKPNLWIVNTGWTGGKYGVGNRIKLSDSANIIDSINNGSLESIPTYYFKHFNFLVPQSCPGIDPKMLRPELTWNSKVQYDETLSTLAIDYIENFNQKFKHSLNQQFQLVRAAGPTI